MGKELIMDINTQNEFKIPVKQPKEPSSFWKGCTIRFHKIIAEDAKDIIRDFKVIWLNYG